jgi:hypothetical protein
MSNVECRMGRLIVGVILLASAKVADAQLTRACCLPNATCAVREPQVCIAQGGVIDSHHTTCAGVVCTGACCLPDGRCVVVIPQSCIAASGTFDSLGSLCDDVVCGGACCRANGSCALSNEASCTSPNTFQGLGSDCGTVDCKGACCLRDGSCEETGEPGCQSDNGVFQGLSAACAETDCAGACCLPDGSCLETSQPGCVQDQSGEFLGLTEACAGAVCTGACCLPEKTCIQAGPGSCAQAGGTYLGRLTDCGDDCPVAMPTAFTYQGQLKRDGVPLNVPIDVRFSLWLSPTGQDPSDQIRSTLLHNGIGVANGLFSVGLDFGQNAFNGNARWLQIEIHGDADPPGTFITLLPRQLLTPTPYALQTRGIVVSDNGNVGIGTKTPSRPLTVHRSGVGLMHEDGNVELATSVNNVGGYVGTLSAHPLSLGSHGNTTMTIAPSLNVGIGPTAPEVRLHITGGSDAEPTGGGYLQLGSSSGENVALDNNEIMARNNGAPSTLFLNNDGGAVRIGQDFALSGQENLRIIRGALAADGTITSGSDFHVNHFATGQYLITFTSPFRAPPSVSAMAKYQSGAGTFLYENLTSGQVEIRTFNTDGFGDCIFTFIAIGPR